MDSSVDDVSNLSVTITRGESHWEVAMTTRPHHADQATAVIDYEFADVRWDKSLVETEVLLTGWLAGRGFTISRPWHTSELTPTESGVVQTEAEFYHQQIA